MSQIIDITVPDIGDFDSVPVIELFVKVGDTLEPEQAICTLESDKATMDVPSSSAGVVTEVLVKVGDRVGQGALLARINASATANAPALAQAQAKQAAAPSPTTTNTPDSGEYDCDVLVLGSGPGGYSAAFRAADLGLKTMLVERYATLGGVCLNVGCIPSKALLHVAEVMDEAAHFGELGVSFSKPKIELDKLRAHKERVVGKLTGGLAGMAKGRKVEVIRGYGKFTADHEISVALTEGNNAAENGQKRNVRFRQCIIAAGSQAVKLPFLPEDSRIVDSTGALALTSVPKRMLVIGGGIIGLEMASVYASLGSKIDIVEMMSELMAGADRDLVKVWQKHNDGRFNRIMLNTKTVAGRTSKEAVYIRFEGDSAPTEEQPYDLVLVAVGRRPNGDKINAEVAGVTVDARGFIAVDKQMRTNQAHISAIGDIVGQPMLAHKAVHEAHVAAEVCAGQKAAFEPLQIPSVAYTHPEIAWAGLTETTAKATGQAVRKAVFPWAASGRAIANGAESGFTKLLFDQQSGRIVGGGIVGLRAGDLISEVCLAIEMGADEIDIGKTIHPHPTLGESIGLAAEVAHGSCTDVPSPRKTQV